MLHFYLVDDNVPRSQLVLTDLTLCGELHEETFFNLQDMGIIEDRFDANKDFRWDTNQVQSVNRYHLILIPHISVLI